MKLRARVIVVLGCCLVVVGAVTAFLMGNEGAISNVLAVNRIAVSNDLHISVTDKIKIQQTIKKVASQINISKIMQAHLPNFYQVVADGEVIYLSHDLRYFFHGNLLDLSAEPEHWNVTERLRQHARTEIIDTIKYEDMVVFSPKEKPKAVVNVFTDVDCIFCKKFHENIEGILAKGIEVRYLAFPRSGIGRETFNKMTAVWCADDRQAAMTAVKAGETITSARCDSAAETLTEQFKLGAKLGINGTPTLIFTDGHMLPSYLDAQQLAELALKHAEKKEI